MTQASRNLQFGSRFLDAVSGSLRNNTLVHVRLKRAGELAMVEEAAG
jgi:hypothetical protein